MSLQLFTREGLDFVVEDVLLFVPVARIQCWCPSSTQKYVMQNTMDSSYCCNTNFRYDIYHTNQILFLDAIIT